VRVLLKQRGFWLKILKHCKSKDDIFFLGKVLLLFKLLIIFFSEKEFKKVNIDAVFSSK